jgi:galactokinase
MDLAVWGDVPLGSGLSSSAAIEVAMATLLNAVTGAAIPPVEIALLAQAAEHSRFVGVKCGIMDQFISALGREDAALMIDCHSLGFECVGFDSSRAAIVIIDSKKKRGLVDSEYNRRRQECAEGLELVRGLAGCQFETIRHIPEDVFAAFGAQLPEGARKRLRHNITENARVAECARALESGDFVRAGELLRASHASLRDDFEVSCRELDRIAELADACDGVYGCRMTGAGFGGCAVALARPEAVGAVSEQVSATYHAEFGVYPEIHVTHPCEGATVEQAR